MQFTDGFKVDLREDKSMLVRRGLNEDGEELPVEECCQWLRVGAIQLSSSRGESNLPNQFQASCAQLVGELIMPHDAEYDTLRVLLDDARVGGRLLDLFNRLYTPEMVFKLLHPLHHLRDAAFNSLHFSVMAFNPAILRLLNDWAMEGKWKYTLFCADYELDAELGPSDALEWLVPIVAKKEENGRGQREYKEGIECFIRTRRISATDTKTTDLHQLLRRISNVSRYCRSVSIRAMRFDGPQLDAIIEASPIAVLPYNSSTDYCFSKIDNSS